MLYGNHIIDITYSIKVVCSIPINMLSQARHCMGFITQVMKGLSHTLDYQWAARSRWLILLLDFGYVEREQSLGMPLGLLLALISQVFPIL